MLDKLKEIENRFLEVEKDLSNPEVTKDIKKYTSLNKEYKSLGKIVEKYIEYKNVLSGLDDAKVILNEEKDEEFKEMAKAELDGLSEKRVLIEEEIKILLIPKDPDDEKSVILEIRAGTGGDEASIFAGDLYRMYAKFCQDKGWSQSIVDFSEGTAGGFKEIIFEVTGNDIYGILKFESGVHRVQRVPQTETQGRVHTSAATVMILPEAEEFDVEINMNDVRVDYFCSSGPGGQSVNTTYSAVRLTHEPTGIVAQCQDQKSQHKNKDKALKVLRSRLYDNELAKKNKEDSEKRGLLVSSGDRSAKIRTYNYPQGRVTDHRIGLTLYDLNNIINGDIQKLIDELQLYQNSKKLKEAGETI